MNLTESALDVLTGPVGARLTVDLRDDFHDGTLVNRVVMNDQMEALVLDLEDGTRRVIRWDAVESIHVVEGAEPAAADGPIKVGDRVRVTSTAPYGDAREIDGRTGVVTEIVDDGYRVKIDPDQGGFWASYYAAPWVGTVERLTEPEAKPDTADDEATYDEGLDITDSDGDTLSLYAGYEDDNAVEVSAKQDGHDAAIVYLSDDDLPKVIAYLQAALTARGAA